MEIKIVKSIKDYEEGLNKRIKKGTLKNAEKGLVMTPETFSKVFSPERIKLLQILRNNLKNIYQLAKEMNKPYEVVFRNIKYLHGIGLISVREQDKKKIPFIDNHLKVDMGVET